MTHTPATDPLVVQEELDALSDDELRTLITDLDAATKELHAANEVFTQEVTTAEEAFIATIDAAQTSAEAGLQAEMLSAEAEAAQTARDALTTS